MCFNSYLDAVMVLYWRSIKITDLKIQKKNSLAKIPKVQQHSFRDTNAAVHRHYNASKIEGTCIGNHL